jgi:hypothetical protein
MLAVKDMEHQIAVYTLNKLNQEHKLNPFLSQLLQQEVVLILYNSFGSISASTAIKTYFQEVIKYDYLPV